MNIRQLQFFCQAVDAGSFSAAAKAENVTVQAVSKSIHELEDEVGGELFARVGRRMRLTPLGESLLEPARRAVESFAAVERVALSQSAAQGRHDLRLALVTPPFSKHEFICGILSRLVARAIGIDTRLAVSLGAPALAELRSGAVDALFTVGRLDAPGCTCTQLGAVRPGVFLGRTHPLRGRRGPLSFADLKPYPALYSPEIDDFNETVLVSCLKGGLESPLVTIETNGEVVDFLERRNGFIMGVDLKALSIRPFATMHEVDPDDVPAVPVCLVVLDGGLRPEVERLERFVRDESPLLGRLLGSDV